jgi:hypothetical protein
LLQTSISAPCLQAFEPSFLRTCLASGRIGELLEESGILAHPFLAQWLKRRILSKNQFEESYGAWVAVGEMDVGEELLGLAQALSGNVSSLPPNDEDGSQQLFVPSSEWQPMDWTAVVCSGESAGSLRLQLPAGN